MIILQSADPKGGEVYVNIDNILLLQRQRNVSGPDFTAVFFIAGPPYAVTESQDEVWQMMIKARVARRTEGMN